MPDAEKIADGIMDEFVVLDDWRNGRDFALQRQFRDAIAAALLAEREAGRVEGLEEAATVVWGNRFLGSHTPIPHNWTGYHYVTWPCFNPRGDVSSDQPEARLSAALAERIRALKTEPRP